MDADERKIRKYLIEEVIRKGRKKIAYDSLNNALGLDLDFSNIYSTSVTIISDWLDNVTNYELENGRPPLSVEVINESEKMPGPGFFKTMASFNKDEDGWERLMKDTGFFNDLHHNSFEEWRKDDYYKRSI